MTRSRFATLAAVAAILLVPACMAVPPFPVSDEQEASLQRIYKSARSRTRETWMVSGRVSKPVVSDILTLYDDDVQAVLDDEQWALYEQNVKDRWTAKLHRTARQGFLPPTTTPELPVR